VEAQRFRTMHNFHFDDPKVLGFTKGEARDLKFELEKTALHCSHAIVAARYTAEWPPRPLLDVSDWQGSFACGDNKHEQQVTAG